MRAVALVASLSCLCLGLSFAEEAAAPAPVPAPAALKPIVLDGIRIYPAERYIEVDAAICLDSGLLELFASSPGGKLHESLLVIKPKPQLIHFGLIILGLKEGAACAAQGAPVPPRGEAVDLFAEWEEDGRTWRVRAEDLVYNTHTHAGMEHNTWVFTGSRFVKDTDPNTGQARDIYLANATGTVITTFRDPSSILDNASEFSADDTSYVVNEAVVPARGTAIRLLIMPKDKGPEAKRALSAPALAEADAVKVPALIEAGLGTDATAAADAVKALAAMGRPVLAPLRARLEAATTDDDRHALQRLQGDVRMALHPSEAHPEQNPVPPTPPKGAP